MNMTLKNKHHGFTLIEMVIVIVILLILIGVSTTIITQEFEIFATGQDLINADWQGRVALDRITKDLRNAPSITTAGSNNISFTDTTGATISYSLSGTQLIYTSTESQPLADDVQNITFTYYDEDGNITAVTSNIRYVTINLNIVNLNANFNLTTGIYLWNIAS